MRSPCGAAARRANWGATGAVVLWTMDATDSESEIGRLQTEVDDLSTAFDALSGLIEAAPLPMWYRGSDLRLAMVNSAYVRAVEGADAADVIARELELVEGSGRGGPRAGAQAARISGKPQREILPATIDGERRSLEVHDVPLPTGGVASFAVDVEDLEQSRAGAKRFAERSARCSTACPAGVAQFGADRGLVFCNQPFRRMFAMRTEWLSDRPEFDRVLERMREANRLPEVRDFPSWKAERRAWFVPGEDAAEENWHLPGGTHLRVVAQPLPDGGLLVIFEDRTSRCSSPLRATRCCGCGPRRSTICSRRWRCSPATASCNCGTTGCARYGGSRRNSSPAIRASIPLPRLRPPSSRRPIAPR